MLYGWATADYFPLFATYLFGDVVAVLYIGVFFRWTAQRSYALKAIGVSALVVVVTALYTILGMTGATGQSTGQVGNVTGYIMAVGSVLLYISPLETIKTVLKTRSGASIPFGMCLAGATSNVLWMINGLLTSDIFIFLLGTVCAALGLLQVVLCLIFRPGRAQAAEAEVAVEPLQPGKKFVLPVTAANSPQSDGTTGTLPSPVFIAVHSP
jgi:solute carrier family 50 protein (sugar transporter)